MKFIDSLKSAVIHEYQMVSPTMAKVTVSMTSNLKKAEATALLRRQLKEAASVVSDSFCWLDQNTAIGFVAASREVRPVALSEIATKYRVMSSNIYLDNEDRTLWEMKEGAAGKYLARRGVDNLEALVQTARVSPTGSTPRMARVIQASVAKSELVAFVNQTEWTAETDYGFCVSSNATHLRVVTESGAVNVPKTHVISSHEIALPALSDLKRVSASEYNEPIKNSEEYYKLAYSYNPEYMEKVIEQVREMAAM